MNVRQEVCTYADSCWRPESALWRCCSPEFMDFSMRVCGWLAKIRLLTPRILNTADELRAVAAALDQQPGTTAIVVTAKAHTRRVRVLWKKISQGHHGSLLVRASSEDSFDPAHWWRTTNDALDVVREYLGLLNAWAGLPLSHTK